MRDVRLLAKTFAYAAAYLPAADDPRPQFGNLGPESSRRSRSFAVWASLRAYGRDGYRALVEHDLDLARALAEQVDAAPELERLAEVPLNIVCFRYRPPGWTTRPRSTASTRGSARRCSRTDASTSVRRATSAGSRSGRRS